MIRATTGGVMRTYRSNLMNSFINMNANRNTVLSQRTFNSFAEDPAAAARAFRLRKARMAVESQYEICTDAMGKYQQAVSCLQSVDDILCTKEGEYGQYMKTITGTTLSMLNDPEGDARMQLSKVLDQLSQQIVQAMNQKYGDNFIFAGADGHNVPFEIVNDKLYYRGVPVDAAIPNVLTDANGNPLAVNANGEIDPTADTYLNLDNVKLVSQNEYNIKYVVPDVYKHGDGTPIECNSDGSVYDPDNDTDPEHTGGYYKTLEGAAAENPADGLMSIDEYNAIKDRAENTVFLTADDGSGAGTTQLVTVNKKGELDENGAYYMIVDASQLMTKADYDQQKTDWEKLQYLAQETQFVDIGFGFQEDPVTGKLIETSAFDISLNGVNFLGYSLDEDGDTKNIYSLIQKMRKVADNASANDSWTTDWNEFNRLTGKLEKAVSKYQTEYVNLDASSGKLKGQQELLTDNFDTLQEQYSDIEDVDMVDAITSFIWAEYCYNAALKVGNSILSESLMDYLR